MDEQKNKVLIIDDDVEFVKEFAEKLRAAGLEPITQLSGVDAIEYIKHNDVDFIVLDFIMPEMDGYTFYKKLTSDLKREIPTIVLTSLSGAHPTQNLEVYEKLHTNLDTLAASIKNKLSNEDGNNTSESAR